MAETLSKYEFDPGFLPHVLAFRGTVEYLYTDINRFKNFSQRKLKFLQYHKKILEIFCNNIGFYTGCLMWAAYLKTQPEGEISSNNCYGLKYDEEENKAETQYLLKFIELFPKDMKYFLGQDYVFDPKFKRITEIYEEFLVLNKGFTETKTNFDLKIPNSINTEKAEEYKQLIMSVIENGDLALLNSNILQIIN